MNRRAFFIRLGGAFVAALASPDLAALLPHTAGSFGAPPPYLRTFVVTSVVESTGLALHPDAFAMVMRPLDMAIVSGGRCHILEGWGTPIEPLKPGDIITFAERNT